MLDDVLHTADELLKCIRHGIMKTWDLITRLKHVLPFTGGVLQFSTRRIRSIGHLIGVLRIGITNVHCSVVPETYVLASLLIAILGVLATPAFGLCRLPIVIELSRIFWYSIVATWISICVWIITVPHIFAASSRIADRAGIRIRSSPLVKARVIDAHALQDVDTIAHAIRTRLIHHVVRR